MRVVAGTRKKLQLKTVSGNHTRPTTDRIKETLFNMLGGSLSGVRFLDLFAGSGQIGIEALSRGASTCVFVENYREAVACIRYNLSRAGFEDRSRVCPSDVPAALSSMGAGERFDIIFMDPPYDKQLERRALEMIVKRDLLERGGTIVVEASLRTDFSYIPKMGLTVIKEKTYKTNKHMFLKRGYTDEESHLSGEF